MLHIVSTSLGGSLPEIVSGLAPEKNISLHGFNHRKKIISSHGRGQLFFSVPNRKQSWASSIPVNLERLFVQFGGDLISLTQKYEIRSATTRLTGQEY